MKKNILITDDDKEMCEEIAEILIDEGYGAETACNGLDCIRLIGKNKYDLLLLDLKMPGLNGFEVLKKVKNEFKGLKIIVLTGRPLNDSMAYENDNQEEFGTLKLADAILNKPYDIEILLSKIRELID